MSADGTQRVFSVSEVPALFQLTLHRPPDGLAADEADSWLEEHLREERAFDGPQALQRQIQCKALDARGPHV